MKILSNFSLYHYSNYLIYWCDRRLGSVFLHMIWRKSASYAKTILKHLFNRNRITGQLNFTPPLTALLLSLNLVRRYYIFSGSVRPGTNPGATSSSGIVWCGPCQSLASSWTSHGQGCWRWWAVSGLSFWAWGCMSRWQRWKNLRRYWTIPRHYQRVPHPGSGNYIHVSRKSYKLHLMEFGRKT